VIKVVLQRQLYFEMEGVVCKQRLPFAHHLAQGSYCTKLTKAEYKMGVKSGPKITLAEGRYSNGKHFATSIRANQRIQAEYDWEQQQIR
jgi:hypothetical protein